MLPNSIRCDDCFKTFDFPDASGGIYLYVTHYDSEKKGVKEKHLTPIPKKPIWCGVCNKPTFAEDLREIRDWEGAFSLVKAGQSVEFPIDTTYIDDKSSVIDEFKLLFDIRKKRTNNGLCLFCGGLQYAVIGSPETGIEHENCGGSFKRLYSISSSNYMISAYKIFSTDGRLIGRLDHCKDHEFDYYVKECSYEE